MSKTSTRAVTSGQAILGAVTVVLAGPIARRVSGGRPPQPWIRPLIWVLGLRQLFQAAIVYAVDDPLLLRAGAVVDALHAASMVPVVFRSPRFRWFAAASASTAAASAAGEVAAASNGV